MAPLTFQFISSSCSRFSKWLTFKVNLKIIGSNHHLVVFFRNVIHWKAQEWRGYLTSSSQNILQHRLFLRGEQHCGQFLLSGERDPATEIMPSPRGSQNDFQGSGLGWLLFQMRDRTTLREQWHSICYLKSPVPSKLPLGKTQQKHKIHGILSFLRGL